MNSENTWHDSVPNWEQFNLEKRRNLQVLAKKEIYRQKGLELLSSLNNLGFSHKNTWLGIPFIRLPEDILLQQQLIWTEKPDLIIEIGVARGGGLVFNASMQEISGIEPKVIGIDNKVYQHTSRAIAESKYNNVIQILEGESTSPQILNKVSLLAQKSYKTLLILDSDHASTHVLNELDLYVPILPIGSLIIVCDTLIDEQPPGTYPNRTWSDGHGPGHAIKTYLSKNKNLSFHMIEETRALVLTEIRDGILIKVSR